MSELVDIPNIALTAGEYIQDVRDRQIRLLGISALAGKLEDLAKPDYPAFQRARWSRIGDVVPYDDDCWQEISPSANSAVNRKNKDRAVIVGAPKKANEDLRRAIGNVRAWPAAAYHYRGVNRAGLLPQGFGEIEDYHAVAMLKGKNEFAVTTGLLWITDAGFLRTMEGRPKRADIKNGRLYLPRGVTVIDEIAADEIPDGVPLI